jgi:AbrB family looped-hinge helix DNA binding protein
MTINFATTRMSSKGQVVIPETVRTELGLRTGARFVVIGGGDTVMLKVISPPSPAEVEATLKRLQRKAKQAGRSRKDVAKVIAEVRGRR